VVATGLDATGLPGTDTFVGGLVAFVGAFVAGFGVGFGTTTSEAGGVALLDSTKMLQAGASMQDALLEQNQSSPTLICSL
jgi:NADH:ubiquinone oxidoreductase subunit 4 (subunit M)